MWPPSIDMAVELLIKIGCLLCSKKKDRMLGGMSRDGNRPTDQYMARAARRWIP
jgi:hypothetical protein